MSSTSKPGGNSAWSRPLNKKIGSSDSSGNNSGSGGGGGGPRPPPGMSNANRSSGNNTSSSSGGGWGNRGSANGSAKKTSPTANTTATSAATKDHEYILRERFLHLILSMVGQTITLTATSGQILEGVFHTFTPFTSLNKDMKNVYVIKACRVVQRGDGSDKHVENGSTVVIPGYKVASVQVKSMRLDALNAAEKSQTPANAAAAGATEDAFQTDSQISGGRGGTQSLVAAGSAWTSAGDGTAAQSIGALAGASAGATASKGADALNWRRAATSNSQPEGIKSAPTSGGLPTTAGGLDGSIGDWDQFSANEKKFNIKASFDENLYTTKLDAGHSG